MDHVDLDGRKSLSRLADDAFVGAPFLADLCHRVRTPLNGILGSLELLLEAELSEESRDLARAAHESAVLLHRAFEAELQAAYTAAVS